MADAEQSLAVAAQEVSLEEPADSSPAPQGNSFFSLFFLLPIRYRSKRESPQVVVDGEENEKKRWKNNDPQASQMENTPEKEMRRLRDSPFQFLHAFSRLHCLFLMFPSHREMISFFPYSYLLRFHDEQEKARHYLCFPIPCNRLNFFLPQKVTKPNN